jgi:hypothetical protein
VAVYVYDTTPPTGYSVNIDQEAINNDNKAAMSFTFAGAEVGATYNYTVTSTGGGSVTGSGTIETVDQQIGDIDVSGLGDGTLILIVTLIDLSGNSGAIVTDTVSKNTAAPMDAAVPVIISDLSTTQVEYNQNAAAAPLDATATVTDGGTITYQWYSNTTNSTVGATALGVTTPAYTPSTATVGTTYYYCVVTNTNNAATRTKTAQTTSAIASIKVNTLVNAVAPVIISTAQVEYNQNVAAAALDATATVTDGGTISYAWYSNTTNSTVGATALGVTTATYTPSTATAGTTYYYCVVTNTNNAATGTKTAQTTSAIANIKVNAAGGGSGSGGGGSSHSSSTVSRYSGYYGIRGKKRIFSNAEDIKVEADVTSAFGQSVTTKLTDDADSQKEIFSLAGANDKVYPFDISLYSKKNGEKSSPRTVTASK